MDSLRIIVSVLTVIMALLTLLPLSKNQRWWVRVWDFPRLQMATLSLLFLLTELWVLPFGGPLATLIILLSLACMLYQAWWILPYTRLYPVQVKKTVPNGHPHIKIINCNVLMTNRNSAKLLEIVEKNRPDILVLLETDLWWEQQMSPLESDYPHSIKCPLDNLYGMHVYSRLPLFDAKIQYLVAEGIPSMHFRAELTSGHQVVLHCLHPMPPSPTEDDESTNRDAELVAVGHTASRASYPTIVTGDLNDVAWSRTTRLFMKVSGLLDPRRGRGMYNTFHASYPFLRWPLDHVFHSKEFTLIDLQRLEPMGSDHFPIMVELALTPEQGKDQEKLQIDSGDIQEAREKMDNAGVKSRDVHHAEHDSAQLQTEFGLPL
ncbi:MAG: endonuclease/exonuclease/phosphatase family protein [Ewingella americana]|jgi:endonuclease/exonuclease/phosphatase (EEP) superfamily protein YafD|uniref:endonuclease/exonuclease/phosphatase family protein n=1 Tax=Ewingella americana TaxID=41202 RepID=UPI00242AB23E|nr:endonuclease/exonuclease/phosphatase family protein [Ewingella americana]MCI1677017.1 endonuclease/exonuclease/phosphatase family protein [Ewingella americana]MCI1853393.1 endonuclease/exonuclease/phosphatase family protein [Ewingella americana]MCI1860366.1 endonuclease/exonuclease/phosphatase family protein [Ewingella americana]MCI2141385.1 endonuclease/exonuclease/phosphatase family protein [Ewingella americana]MCI2162900.1 endonuclease/exonuclease/phosphatase family protein [Ewingella am